MSKGKGLASFLSFVVAGAVVGLLLSVVLPFAIWLTLGEDWVNATSFLFKRGSFVSFPIIGGLVGLWIGYRNVPKHRNVPNPGKAAYLLALILILSFPAGFFIWTRNVRITREAAARANLASWGAHATHYKLGQFVPGDRDQKAHYEVTDEQGVIGEVFVSPLLGFLWKSEGGVEGTGYRR